MNVVLGGAFGAGPFSVLGKISPNRIDLAVHDRDVGDLVEMLRRIDDPSAGENHRTAMSDVRRPLGHPFAFSANSGFPPESRYSTAIRTATPFVT